MNAIIQIIQQNFLNPIGFLALTAIIPLLIFYLVKPQPEEKVMPSMTFFSKKEQKGKIRQSLEKINRNKLLILHLIFLLGLATALANPLLKGIESENPKTIIIDNSGSMNDNVRKARKHAKNNLGKSNTIITTSPNPQLVATEASPERTRKIINDIDFKATGTDLISSLTKATNYEGDIVVISDMANTDAGDLEDNLDKISQEKTVEIKKFSHKNSHAFTDINFENQNAVITVKNYLPYDRELTINSGLRERTLNISASSEAKLEIKLNSNKSKRVIKLPKDQFRLDNEIYISTPKNGKINVKRLGRPSEYFKTAINLINQTKYSSGNDISNADVYYVSEDYQLNEDRPSRLKKQIKLGKSVIIQSRDQMPDFSPLQNFSGVTEKVVSINDELSSSFSTQIKTYTEFEGKSLSQPRQAITLSKDEKVLVVNVEEEKFGQKITYPIFMKNLILRMSDEKQTTELNLKTNSITNFSTETTHRTGKYKGPTRITKTGFYEGRHIYAANMLQPEESEPRRKEITTNYSSSDSSTKTPAAEYMILGLIALSLLETFYLSSRGAI